MSRISISTSKYIKSKIKEVEIDGVIFTVRKPGAGEQLDSLENMRAMNKLKAQMDSAETEPEQMKIMDEVAKVMAKIEDSFVNLFDDGTGNNKNAKNFVRKVGIENIGNVLNDIFKEGDE